MQLAFRPVQLGVITIIIIRLTFKFFISVFYLKLRVEAVVKMLFMLFVSLVFQWWIPCFSGGFHAVPAL